MPTKKLPRIPSVTYHLAYAYFKNGELEKAKNLLSLVLKQDIQFPEKKQCKKLLEEIEKTLKSSKKIMYLEFFGLKREPFHISPDPYFFLFWSNPQGGLRSTYICN